MPMRLAVVTVLMATCAHATERTPRDMVEFVVSDLKMSCKGYRFSDQREGVVMEPNEGSLWVVINEGPAPLTIRASNGDEIPIDVFDGNLTTFLGDDRYSYVIGLTGRGSATVHVCQ